MTQVYQGDSVRVRYTGRLSDGTVFDATEDDQPLEFVAGEGQVIEGVDQAVIGMQEGEQKSVTISAEKGFGVRDAALEQTVDRSQLPEEVKVGDRLRAMQGEEEISVWVRRIDEQSAVIDANHPLAGQTLSFELEVISIQSAKT